MPIRLPPIHQALPGELYESCEAARGLTLTAASTLSAASGVNPINRTSALGFVVPVHPRSLVYLTGFGRRCGEAIPLILGKVLLRFARNDDIWQISEMSNVLLTKTQFDKFTLISASFIKKKWVVVYNRHRPEPKRHANSVISVAFLSDGCIFTFG